MATQHPYATPVWLDSLAALSRGQLSDDLLLIVDLERELANCQVLASTRTRQLAEQKSFRDEAGQGHGACLASVGESAAAPFRAAHAAEDGEQGEEELVEQQRQQQQREQREQQQQQQQQREHRPGVSSEKNWNPFVMRAWISRAHYAVPSETSTNVSTNVSKRNSSSRSPVADGRHGARGVFPVLRSRRTAVPSRPPLSLLSFDELL